MQTSIVHDIHTANPQLTRFALRKLLLAQRFTYSSHMQSAMQSKLVEQTLSYIHQHTTAQDTIALFSPTLAEPDFLAAAQQLHRTIALPVVIAAKQALQFALWQPQAPLILGQYNIAIPAKLEWVRPNILVIPCLGFNAQNYRLGYGGGFYDRTLSSLRQLQPQTIAIGVAYPHCQCVFNPQTFDIPMDIILTGD